MSLHCSSRALADSVQNLWTFDDVGVDVVVETSVLVVAVVRDARGGTGHAGHGADERLRRLGRLGRRPGPGPGPDVHVARPRPGRPGPHGPGTAAAAAAAAAPPPQRGALAGPAAHDGPDAHRQSAAAAAAAHLPDGRSVFLRSIVSSVCVMRSTLIRSCTPTPTRLRIHPLPIHSRSAP